MVYGTPVICWIDDAFQANDHSHVLQEMFSKDVPYVISMWSMLMFPEWDWYMLYVFENVIRVYANSWNCL